ncbi:MAG: class I SAM-dependent methyltransferase [Alphaproteobacteria bacterium]
MNEAFRARGKTFDDTDVARCYAFRPPYAAELFEAVLARVPDRSALLDLGTGNGKIAGALASKFRHVTAVDPSRPMLHVARELWQDRHNIDWVCSTAEDAPLSGPYDLVTAGASMHWMNPAVLFPKLAQHLSRNGLIAIIVGDFPMEPPWQEAWTSFVSRITERMGGKYDPKGWLANYETHEPWIDIELRQTFVHTCTQSVDDFIECQHSRASWARQKLGPVLCADFDREAKALLVPYARGGTLHFNVDTDLTIGRPRSAPITQ